MRLVELNEKEYCEFTESHNAHFLQSYEWGELSKTRNFIPYYVGLKNDDKVVASALLLKKNLLLGYSYIYIPRSYTIDYNNFELLKTFTEEIKKFAKSKKAIFFKIDPAIKLQTIDENANPIEGENNYELVENLKKIGFKHLPLTKLFETSQPRYTFRIDVTKDIDTLVKNYHPKCRNYINKANSYLLNVKIGDRDDIKEFIRLMKMTEKRQDFYSHDSDYYYKFYDIFNLRGHIKLLLAELDFKKVLNMIDNKLEELEKNKKADTKQIEKLKSEKEFYLEKSKDKNKEIISACIMVYYGNKSWYLYGANDKEYKSTFANYKLLDYQIKLAHDSGIEIFDEFGTIGDLSGDSPLIGIHEFKKRWGGEYIEFVGEFDYILNSFMYFIYKTLIPIRHKLVNKKLKRDDK